MRIKLTFVCLLLCAVALAACGGTTPAPQPAATAPADTSGINDLRSRYQSAYNAGDAAAVAALYTDDAVSLVDHRAALNGKAAIQQHLQDMFAMYTANLTLMAGDAEISGDTAHEHGTYTMSLTPKAAGGTPVTENGKYLVVLKRQADGSWKVHHDMDNAAAAHPGMHMPGMPMSAPGRR